MAGDQALTGTKNNKKKRIAFGIVCNNYLDARQGKKHHRPAYYASGRPQGLGKYTNNSTGIANLAGRYAAVMAMAYDIFRNTELPNATEFAATCLQAGKEVFFFSTFSCWKRKQKQNKIKTNKTLRSMPWDCKGQGAKKARLVYLPTATLR